MILEGMVTRSNRFAETIRYGTHLYCSIDTTSRIGTLTAFYVGLYDHGDREVNGRTDPGPLQRTAFMNES
jgi:hypothetical protein